MTRAQHFRSRLSASLAAAAAGLLAAATLTVAATSAHAAIPSASPAPSGCAHSGGPARVGRIGGIAHAVAVKGGCPTSNLSDPAIGTPPLLFHGGPVMGTHSTGPVVITPIFWNPAGHPMDPAYKNLLNTYVSGVAAASGQHTNVYSTLNEYYGSNGNIRYNVRFGTPVNDTSALPANGCTLSQKDTANIYADSSGYDACLDDAQIITETDTVLAARALPRDYGHIYVMFLPKHVESCFFPGSTNKASNFCTINHWPSAAYCAYHSQAPSGTVYANMPFPIYQSAVGFTCGSDANFPVIQSPNGNPDADVEISPTSHEVMESITDPDTATGWYDSSGFENGDECAYVYGATQGAAGQMYNQVIGGRRYLTQEEFSNRDFARTGGGCLPNA
jgi:hypothetical protein